MSRIQTGILVFPDVEVLDFCGPFEVLSVTRLNEDRRREEVSPFEIFLVAEKKDTISATGGLKISPDYIIEECPALDLLIVPGGWGTRAEMHNRRLVNWIVSRSTQVKTIASVCTGALLLGAGGLLDGRKATTHWRSLEWMAELFPRVSVEKQVHFIEDAGPSGGVPEGRLFTSAGISAGIDMSLQIVRHHFGEEVARQTARHMEYPFPEHNQRRIPIS